MYNKNTYIINFRYNAYLQRTILEAKVAQLRNEGILPPEPSSSSGGPPRPPTPDNLPNSLSEQLSMEMASNQAQNAENTVPPPPPPPRTPVVNRLLNNTFLEPYPVEGTEDDVPFDNHGNFTFKNHTHVYRILVFNKNTWTFMAGNCKVVL